MPKSKFPIYVIGLMSGTSADGVDGVILKINDHQDFEIQNSISIDYPDAIKTQIRQLTNKKITGVSEAENLDMALGEIYAEMANELLASLAPKKALVIGCHGQTIHHSPNSNPPFSLQIGNGQYLANLTKHPVVSDFRSADILAGGQGAPLAPGFHQAAFSSDSKNIAIINIGGISNITVLPKNENFDVIGFDTGPGNTLMDYWCRTHFKSEYDNNGDIAKTGELQLDLLDILLKDPYFNKPSPKSTGLEYFNHRWLNSKLGLWEGHGHCSNTDILTTLTVLTSKIIAAQLTQIQPRIERAYVCGGGSENNFLINNLREQTGLNIETTQALGIDPKLVEAAAFAWMAYQTMNGKPSILPSVTGATVATIAGKINTSKEEG